MAIDINNIASVLKQMKSRVKTEMNRRNAPYGNMSSYAGTGYDYTNQPIPNNPLLQEHEEKIVNPLLAVKDFGTKNTVTKEFTNLEEAQILLTQLEAELVHDDTKTSCRSACSGMCLGTCHNQCDGCTTGCSNGCSSCTGGCGSGCNNACGGACTVGCGTGCAHNCGGACTIGCGSGCVNGCYGCAGCTGSCDGGCSGCTSSCSGSCWASCGYGCSTVCGGSR